jgi:hypothetical protein
LPTVLPGGTGRWLFLAVVQGRHDHPSSRPAVTRSLPPRPAGGAWIILLSLGVATAAAYYFSSRQEKLYRASADVYLNTQNLAYALSNVTLPSVDPARLVATQADVATTPVIAEGAIRLAKVHGRTADDLLKNSSVGTKVNADLLTFSVSDRSPAVASRLATAYARAYTNYRLAFDTRSIVSARRQVERQLKKMQATGAGASTLYATLAANDQQLQTMEALQGSNTALLRAAGDAHQIQPRPGTTGFSPSTRAGLRPRPGARIIGAEAEMVQPRLSDRYPDLLRHLQRQYLEKAPPISARRC